MFQLPLIEICIARSRLAELGDDANFELGNDRSFELGNDAGFELSNDPSFEFGNDPNFELGNDARRHICDNSSAFKRLYDFCIFISFCWIGAQRNENKLYQLKQE